MATNEATPPPCAGDPDKRPIVYCPTCLTLLNPYQAPPGSLGVELASWWRCPMCLTLTLIPDTETQLILSQPVVPGCPS